MQELMFEMGEQLQVWLYFVFLLVFIAAEKLSPRRPLTEPRAKRWQSNGLLTLLVIMALPLLPLSLITAAFWAEGRGIGMLNSFEGILQPAGIVLLTLLVRGFISFFTHFLNHKVKFLWRFHRVHHLDTGLDVSSTVRFHPLEMVFSVIIGVPIVLLFGLSPWVLILYELLDVTVNLFSHSNIRIPAWINRWLRYVIVTPDLHAVHHSSWQPETDSNFSAVFPVWDIVFGTFRTETREPIETMQLGLQGMRGPEVNGFWWLLWSPFMNDGSAVESNQSNQGAQGTQGTTENQIKPQGTV